VDELSETEVEAALTRLLRDREAVEQWAAAEDTEGTEDAWAQASAREAIREEPWLSRLPTHAGIRAGGPRSVDPCRPDPFSRTA
jgi:hypothetical protein